MPRHSHLAQLLVKTAVLALCTALWTGTAGADSVIVEASRDNTIYGGVPGVSNGYGEHFFAGRTSNGDLRRALVFFDIPGNVPPGATIDDVTVTLHVNRVASSTPRTVGLHRLLADWGEGSSNANGNEGTGAPATEGDATWFERIYPDLFWNSPGGDFDGQSGGTTSIGGIGFYSWSSPGLIAEVQSWREDPSANFGWIVIGDEGGDTKTAKRFDSRSTVSPVERPRITVEFTPSGIPAGGCCLPDGGCIILTPSDCVTANGSYQGNGTTCTTDPCGGEPITILIDPSRDNTLFEDAEGLVSNGSGEFFFAGITADLLTRRGLLGFDLASVIPQGSIVADATLTLRKTFGGSAAHDATLHRALSDWGEGTSDAPGDEEDGAPAEAGDATWLHRSYPTIFWDTPGGDYDPNPSATTYVAFEDFYSWRSQGMVRDLQAWVDDPSQNFGWFVIGKEDGTVITRKRYVSRESGDLDYRPKLEITYSIPPGVEYQIPPVPVPPENPITEAKRVLGKILFWDEQLSSDDTIACGTCHQPGAGGVDPRLGQHPGFDLVFGTDDDILGSPGVRRADPEGNYIPDSIFGDDVQVTGRNSQSFFGGLWSQFQFWDGRSGGEFRDPVTDEIEIASGGALENQAIVPILSDVEMAFEDRDWNDVTTKVAGLIPMAIASDLPADMLDAIAADPSYPELFDEAFGDPEVTVTRIAFAIATYERTLVSDQTPWDSYKSGDAGALTPEQIAGATFVQEGPCGVCHGGPLFTDNVFRNIGLRPSEEDIGREAVTGNENDRGRFKVPSLRNVGLRPRLTHTGQIEDVRDALEFYAMIGHTHFVEDQDESIEGGIAMTPEEMDAIEDFLVSGLTDPRVAAELFPFDRPTLASEQSTGVEEATSVDLRPAAFPNPFREAVEISFSLPAPGAVRLSIFAPTGQRVSELRIDGVAGPNVIRWNGKTVHGNDAGPGVYFVRLATAAGTSTGRIVRID